MPAECQQYRIAQARFCIKWNDLLPRVPMLGYNTNSIKKNTQTDVNLNCSWTAADVSFVKMSVPCLCKTAKKRYHLLVPLNAPDNDNNGKL